MDFASSRCKRRECVVVCMAAKKEAKKEKAKEKESEGAKRHGKSGVVRIC